MESGTVARHAGGGPTEGLAAANLIEAFLKTVDRLGEAVAIRDKGDSFQISWNELRERAAAVAGGLAELGVGKGDTVALMMMNRPEFNICDLAAVARGAVPFSIYQTSSPEQIAYLLGDAESRVAIVEQQFLGGLEQVRDQLPGLEHLIVIDGDGGDRTLAAVEELGEDVDLRAAAEALEPDDLLTLIYTSGTTGPPKGVMLSHRNL